MNDNQLITLEEYNKLSAYEIIRTGLISNSSTGCFMTNDDELPLLRFIIVKRIEGWTAYFGKASQSAVDIKSFGDKSNTPLHIRRVFPCTNEVFKLYIP